MKKRDEIPDSTANLLCFVLLSKKGKKDFVRCSFDQINQLKFSTLSKTES